MEFEIGNLDEDLISFLSLAEICGKSTACDQDIQELSQTITSQWWQENKERLVE